VIKKASDQTKEKMTMQKLSKRDKTSAKSVHGKRLSKETLKQVSDLAFYVRYQKTKVDSLNKKSKGKSVTSEQEKLMRRMSSTASVNSMDAFLAKADLNEMAHFLSFCGGVAAEKLGQKVPRKPTTENNRDLPCKDNNEVEKGINGEKFNKQAIQNSLKSMKLGLKQKFTSKRKVTRTTSTGTMSSTDTGYQSVGSERTSTEVKAETDSQSVTGSGIHERNMFVLSDFVETPRHSTPIIEGRSQKRPAEDTDCTFTGDSSITADKLEHLDEAQGKSVILQKFMADQSKSASSLSFTRSDDTTTPAVKRQRTERYSSPVFSDQEEKCSFLSDQYCDSVFGSESEASEPNDFLDIAFHSETTNQETSLQSQPRTLRRESAISNLNRFSLVSRGTEHNTYDENTGIDYSFDCSFPRMDESQSEEYTADFTYSFDETEIELEDKDKDNGMVSFTKTKSFLNFTDDVTLRDINDKFKQSFSDSDSDPESEASEVCDVCDIAFHDETTNQETSVQSRPRTLRRESAISNLNRFSLVSRGTEHNTSDENTGFDYSFDCSFTRMDESQSEEYTADFTYSFDETESNLTDDVIVCN
jgi:hypothetical protein